MTTVLKSILLLLLAALACCGCSSDAKTQAKIRQAYAAGQQAARAQMEQQQKQQQQQLEQQQQQQMQAMGSSDPLIRVLGHVKNPIFEWTDGMTLGRALVQAQYESNNTPHAITIYRNNQPIQIDPQRLLQGQDFPLYPGDTVWIQE